MNTLGAPFFETSSQLALPHPSTATMLHDSYRILPFYGIIHGFKNPIKILEYPVKIVKSWEANYRGEASENGTHGILASSNGFAYWHLSYTHTERQAAAARSHWNEMWRSNIGPRPIPKCQPKRQNFKAAAAADAWCGYTLKEMYKRRKCSV